jgi:hypothetical protein
MAERFDGIGNSYGGYLDRDMSWNRYNYHQFYLKSISKCSNSIKNLAPFAPGYVKPTE